MVITMKLYRCKSRTAKCILIDKNGNKIDHKWNIEEGEIYAADYNSFPKAGTIKLIPTYRKRFHRTKRILAEITIEITADIFRKCFEEASTMGEIYEA